MFYYYTQISLLLNHVEFVFFRINWQKYARNKAKKETSRSNQKWIPLFPFYSCGCKIFIVLPNRYLTEFIGLVNARKIKSQWKPCVCASLKMCFSIDSLAIHLQTFIDCESLKCKQHKKNVHILYHSAYQSMARFPALELLTNFDFTHSCMYQFILRFLYSIRPIHYQSKMRAQLLN